MARLLLAGYFGCGNHGDDAILLGFLEGIRSLGHEVSVLASKPEKMVNIYGLRAVPRMDPGQVGSAMDECDALVFPGGSIFQDVSSVRSTAYYAGLVKAAKKRGKKAVLLAQGVGPLNTFFGRAFARKAFQRADLVTVRDPESAKALHDLGVRRQVLTGGDMAYLLPAPKPGEGEAFGAGGMKSVVLAPRPYGKDGRVVELFSDLTRRLFQAGFAATLVAMDEQMDVPLIQKIAEKNGGKVPELKGVSGPIVLQERLSRMEGVIAMRLHAGILAANSLVPAYMISYDPKVAAFANSVGAPTPPRIETVDAARVIDGFQTLVKDRDRRVEDLRGRLPALRKAAEVHVEALARLLG